MTTLFFDNLPLSMTIDWMEQIFKHKGELMDILLSCKTRKTNRNKFGFVRYGCREEVVNVVEKMDEFALTRCHIRVNFARYECKNVKGKETVHVENKTRKKDILLFLSQRDGQSYREVMVANNKNKAKT